MDAVIIIVFFPLAVFFAVMGVWPVAAICAVLSGAALVVGLLAGLVRVGLSVFGETQMRLSEMLLTVLVAGGLTTAVLVVFESAFKGENANARRAALGMFVLLLLGAGSTWGWSICRRMELQETWPRLRSLFIGWLFAAGGAVCTLAVPTIIIMLVERDNAMRFLWHTVVALVVGAIFLVPGIRVELACRRKARSSQKPPTEGPPPEQQ